MSLPESVLLEIRGIFEKMLDRVERSVMDMALKEILYEKNPLVRVIFAREPRKYLHFFVTERAERSFVTTLGGLMEEIISILIKHQGGAIIGRWKHDWKPFNLKFCMPDGKEYWVEIISILKQNKSKKKSIQENLETAISAGREFRLFVYYDVGVPVPKEWSSFTLVDRDFWSFVGGSTRTKDQLFEVLENLGEKFSLEDIIERRVEKLLKQLQVTRRHIGNFEIEY